jgi:hypothetical protein
LSTSLGFKRTTERVQMRGAVTGDVPVIGTVIAAKIIRLMVIWIALFFVDRAWQSSYLDDVVVKKREPYPLWPVMAAALGVEACVYAILFGLLAVLSARFKRPGNTFVVDGFMMKRLAADYFRTTVPILILGSALGAITQRSKYLRYDEDGMRAIRAHCTSLLFVSFLTLFSG